MPTPLRFSVTTYNLWGENRWPDREKSLRQFLRANAGDILCLQEFRKMTQDVIDQELKNHNRVEDDFEGWGREGNIYWNSALFDKKEHGAEKIGMEGPNPDTARRLFWARLQVKETGKTILIANAHYTFQNHKKEKETGKSPRIEQAKKTIEALKAISPENDNEPVIFMGDLNDPITALGELRRGGLKESWQAQGIMPVITWPAFPTARGGINGRPSTVQVLDWQFHRGPLNVMANQVGDFFFEDLAPSDHKPLTVVYSLD